MPRISPSTGEVVEQGVRDVPEWIGKTPSSIPPRTVRARVFRRYGGVCYLSKRKILAGEPWDLEHVRPLSMARPGENLNRETNLAPALKAPHVEKTAAENTARAKADRCHAKHYGYWPESKNKLKGRGFERSRGAALSRRTAKPSSDPGTNPEKTTKDAPNG